MLPFDDSPCSGDFAGPPSLSSTMTLDLADAVLALLFGLGAMVEETI